MYLVVGAGLAGSVISERIANVLDKKVLLIDRRNHIGGNVYDYKNSNGIYIHKYGPHIFHTNKEKVWSYLNFFVDFEQYYHRVLAVVDGMKIPLPFNINSLFKVFPKIKSDKLLDLLLNKYEFGEEVPILDFIESDNKTLNKLGEFIYEKIFLHYTIKQWGLSPEDIDKAVTSRVPIRLSEDNRYFKDKYQGLPENGYTNMIKKMIDSSNIEVSLDTGFNDITDQDKFDKIIYTGCIDEYFNFKYGELDYRSLNFENKEYGIDKFQETSQVNYPNDYNYTRITEPKHFYRATSGIKNRTNILIEYPTEYSRDKNEPYYPVLDEYNKKIYNKYNDDGKNLDNTIFIGRLADYKYYNMDDIIAKALHVFKNKIRE